MGLFDAMFGGGTKVELLLDTPSATAGGVIGGKVVLHGGKKPYPLKELTVSLIASGATGGDDDDDDDDGMARQVVAAGVQLAASSRHEYAFRLAVPVDAPSTAHDVSYAVVAEADIPGVVDPSTTVGVNVMASGPARGADGGAGYVVGRFPGLESQDEDELCDALRELFLASYSEGASLMEAEPRVRSLVETGSVRVRRAALEAWANLVDNRVQPHHLHVLYAVANRPGLDEETFEQVIVAATKFAEEGALPLVQQLAGHPEETVRARVASNLRFNAAEKFQGKRELLGRLADDASAEVRAEAVGALTSYADDTATVQWIAAHASSDPSPRVQAACVSALTFACFHDMASIALGVWEKQAATNPNASVRAEVARGLGRQPPAALSRVYALAQRLASDADDEVREAIAFEFHNLSEFPQLLPVAQHMAERDASPEVRRRALEGMSGLMTPDHAAAFYGSRLAHARTEEDLWPLVSALRSHGEHPAVRRLLTQIGQCPFPDIAEVARDAMN